MTNMIVAWTRVREVITLFQQCDDDVVQSTRYAQEYVEVILSEISH